ncbi:hypothetical protein CSUB01_10660 [Colletotrichum sublineola]|uniref:Uncharacterized protein n=1 Tax=Colletotrichum sublineola TaxID=1173701 RepID=A0A066XAT4_COLSU|nr:hypothetical protein CSUB01_10660 [Colletotrichum sublineola]
MNGCNDGGESGIRLWEDLEKREEQLAGRVQFGPRAVLLERTPLKSRAVSWGLGADVGCWTCFKQSPRVAVTWATQSTKTCIKACAARDCSCPHPVRWERYARGLGFMPEERLEENRSKDVGPGRERWRVSTAGRDPLHASLFALGCFYPAKAYYNNVRIESKAYLGMALDSSPSSPSCTIPVHTPTNASAGRWCWRCMTQGWGKGWRISKRR